MNSLTLTINSYLTSNKKELIISIVKYLCLFLFIYTAYAKLADHDRFYKGLTKVHLVSGYAMVISYLVPAIEILISILLIIPNTVKIGLISFMTTMTAFTVYIICAMIWEPKLPCHCGGAIEKLSWMQHIWFNLAFIILTIIALWLLNFSKSLKKQVS
ncbi:Methylamine utilisation protein MauE [Mucilaginibacter gossypiicola]|uniref:Methylamine utilisation protein MauE n=1 Tax=Mucilaginibacter gossypiicola TaxID=551995 RepID=A0A1H8DMW0_9SPHI|nr:MauE/DoxX family redox-associated membrane protein [Mucilaginibacter gossypiicola]SEN08485.1 Methylamine utilisation protein MauE [Mucilaginibacter gossypiicola]